MKLTWTVSVSLLPLIVGCRGEAGDGADREPKTPVVWRLSDQPVLEIGVVEGDPLYELHAVTSSRRQANGRVIVGNTGSQEIRVYDSAGRHVWTAGGRGGGPGEFRWLSRVYAFSEDSIAALDMAGNRMSVFDGDGEFIGLFELDRSDDTDFPLDVWLYQQYWVDGALDASRKRTVRLALDRMPIPTGEPGYRYARIDADDNIWICEPSEPSDSCERWTVFDSGARLVAVVETPLRFEIHDIGRDYVLGRWQDEHDVEFVHLYDLEKTLDRAAGPHWIAATQLGAEPGRRDAAVNDDEFVQTLRSAIMNLVTAQESYFADSMRYSAHRQGLEWEGPEGVGMDIVSAGPTGWAAVLTHRETRTICGVFVGGNAPPGWTGEAIPKCR